MLYGQNLKTNVLTFATVSTSATASARIDRLGYNAAVFSVTMPPATATNSSAKWATLAISQGDSTAISSATAITALTGSTNTSVTSGFVIGAQNDTTNPQVTKLFVDTKAQGRYLYITYQGAASHQTAHISCDLFRPEQAPVTDANRGLNTVSAVGP